MDENAFGGEEAMVTGKFIRGNDDLREVEDVRMRVFVEEQGYSFPVFYDTESQAAIAYAAYSIPTTYFIDAEGYAVAWAQSALDAETLQKGLSMILPQ